MKNAKLQLYSDTLVIEALLSDPATYKVAQSGIIGSIIEKVKELFTSHIDPDNKLDSIINMLAPSMLTMLGFPIIGILVEIAKSWFHLDLGAIFSDIGSGLKSLLAGGAKTTSTAVENLVANVFNNHSGATPTADDMAQANLTQLQSRTDLQLREAQFFKLSLLQIQNKKLEKTALLGSLAKFLGLRSTTLRSLIKIVGWIIKVLLATAGFMAVDDAVHSFVGTPSYTQFNTPMSATKPSVAPSVSNISYMMPTQTVFKVNPNYNEEHLNMGDHWIEPVAPTQIGDEIVKWTEDIYPDTSGMDEQIKSTSGFNKALQAIDEYNASNKLNITFIPPEFTSRKKVVDLFIDELANKAPAPAPSSQPSSPPSSSSKPKMLDVSFPST